MTRTYSTQFSQVVQFLGSALGPDYEITLYDLGICGQSAYFHCKWSYQWTDHWQSHAGPLQATLSGSGSEEDFMLHTTERLQINGENHPFFSHADSG